MDKLRITAIPDNRSVRMTVSFPAEIHRDLVLYAQFLADQDGGNADVAKNPGRLVPIMIARFLERDRVFLKKRKDQGEAMPVRRSSKE